MLVYRCLNDVFGYCAGTPDSDDLRPDGRFTPGARCKLDNKTCGLYRTASEKYPETNQELGNFRVVKVTEEKLIAEGKEIKGKSKKKKKEKPEQLRLEL